MAVIALWANPLVRGLSGIAIGACAGECANVIYRNCSQEEKVRWQDKRVMHHGELGVYAVATALKTRSPFLTGLGIGLAISDIDDREEWFKQWPVKLRNSVKGLI